MKVGDWTAVFYAKLLVNCDRLVVEIFALVSGETKLQKKEGRRDCRHSTELSGQPRLSMGYQLDKLSTEWAID